MKWQGRRGSGNVEDRRGMGGRGMAIGGVGGGVGIIILLVVMLLGGDPSAILNQSAPTGGNSGLTQEQQQEKQFASVVLADTEDVWRQQFREMGRTYQDPRMVLFTEYVQSACGGASSQVGPFYCPADQKVYIDLGFFDELSRKYGAPGDFAKAYAHRPRGRPPRPEPARHQRRGALTPTAGLTERGQRAVGAARAPG